MRPKGLVEEVLNLLDFEGDRSIFHGLKSNAEAFSMEKETGLVVFGNAKLGRALVGEAGKSSQAKLQERAVSTVRELLSQIEVQREQCKTSQAAIKIMELRVEAIKAGKFTVDNLGTITFTDKKLHKDLCYVTQCRQCGYPKTVIAKI